MDDTVTPSIQSSLAQYFHNRKLYSPIFPNYKMFKFVTLLLVLVTVYHIDGHGRFMKPPNRSSIWRVPEFAAQNPPQNYDDNQLYCGGLHQEEVDGENCGVCGDPFDQAKPRDNEIGGTWDRGIIVADYTAGQTIDIEVDLTQAHLGYMQFRLCDNPADASNQACFNKYLLQLGDGSGTDIPVSATGLHTATLRLPTGVTCERCVIQWNYRSGNRWGECEDGSSGMGCGPQETFRGCSDVRIH